jgi:acyl-CoA thioester hydrolase
MIEVWRGAVNAWEVDEMGHMNVRFYLARLVESMGGLAAAIGLPDAYTPPGVSTLLVRELHVRFLKEALEGAPLHMEAGVLEVSEGELLAVFVLLHSETGAPCAAFTARLFHARASDVSAFPWSSRTRDAFAAAFVERPSFAEPRSIAGPQPLETPLSTAATRMEADRLGLMTAARGMAMPADCDVRGRLRPDAVMLRFSDGAAHVFDYLTPGHPQRLGGVMLEARMLFHRTASVGALLELRSGLAQAGGKVERVVHWLLHGDGTPIVTAEAAVGALDLGTRRLTALPEDVARARSGSATPQLSA